MMHSQFRHMLARTGRRRVQRVQGFQGRQGIAVLLVLFVILFPTPIFAQEEKKSVDACTDQIYKALAHEQRLYRSVIFGVRRAADEALGATRYDADGVAWIKLGSRNGWRSADQLSSLSDTDIDTISDTKTRRGILETRQALTSELIPPLTQSYRALGCRVASVCEAVRMSRVQSPGFIDRDGFFTEVKVPGCIPFKKTFKPFTACTNDVSQQIIRDACDDVGNRMIAREADVLKTIVAYDAAYRSLLQFAGNFDQFLGSFRVSLLTPVRQTVSLLGALARIPCFLSQCDK